jgi:glycosyltransferase involved in cell wall biosynthesis
MRLLFVKHALAWPRTSGHDVHTFYMMKACAELGHEIALATVVVPDPRAIDGLPLVAIVALDTNDLGGTVPIRATALQHRFRRFWGIPDARVIALRTAVRDLRADAVVVVGLDALPYFPALSNVARVWYAADEWVLHHVSQLRPGSRTVRDDLRDAVVKGLYERAHRRVVDRVWVVTERDRRAMRWIAGFDQVDVLPNGVDGDFFAPALAPPDERTAVFWGRLDFGPNIQALDWFIGRVWPLVRARAPGARFTIVGFHPTAAVRELASADGVSLQPDLPDLRVAVSRHALAVLPFVSGAGIKNKLLEAAALGLPIVCTPKAQLGLQGKPPLAVAASPAEFAAAVTALWDQPSRRRQMALDGRTWVLHHHTWTAVAREAIARLEDSPTRRASQRQPA